MRVFGLLEEARASTRAQTDCKQTLTVGWYEYYFDKFDMNVVVCMRNEFNVTFTPCNKILNK